MNTLNVTALMTAKGNNTLHRKNLLPVCGHPLIWYPATAAKNCQKIRSFFCSSDSEEILDVCESIGYSPIRRPASLALPQSKHVDALHHALCEMKEKGVCPDVLIVLLGNTVFLKTEWLSQAIAWLEEDETRSCVAAVYQEQDQHPFRARKLDASGCLVPYFDFDERKISTNRQELPPNFYFSHNFWALRLKDGMLSEEGFQPWSFMGFRIKPLVVEEGFDVHTTADIVRCEAWVKKNLPKETNR